VSEVRRVMRNNDGVVTTHKKFLRTVGLGIAQRDTKERTDLHFRVTSHSVKKDKRVVVVNQSRKSIIHNIYRHGLLHPTDGHKSMSLFLSCTRYITWTGYKLVPS